MAPEDQCASDFAIVEEFLKPTSSRYGSYILKSMVFLFRNYPATTMVDAVTPALGADILPMARQLLPETASMLPLSTESSPPG